MRTTESNPAKLRKFVAGHIEIASGKSPAEAERHLTQWADWLSGQAALLGDLPHLVGVTAFDIVEGVEALVAAIPLKAVA